MREIIDFLKFFGLAHLFLVIVFSFGFVYTSLVTAFVHYFVPSVPSLIELINKDNIKAEQHIQQINSILNKAEREN